MWERPCISVGELSRLPVSTLTNMYRENVIPPDVFRAHAKKLRAAYLEKLGETLKLQMHIRKATSGPQPAAVSEQRHKPQRESRNFFR
jgi:hypothetical protein